MVHFDGVNARDTVLDFRMATSLSSAVAIEWAPSGTRYIQIEVEDQPIRIREDNTAPTTTVGRKLYPGDCITLYPQPGDIAKINWSEILTNSEAEFMRDRVLPHLASLPWCRPLVESIQRSGGIRYENKPLLFEARVAYALDQTNPASIAYEFSAGVGGGTVDFRVGETPPWLLEVVSIQRSAAAIAATSEVGPFTVSRLSSPRSDQTLDERKQSEEGESLLVVQKIGEKVHDELGPIKFPIPTTGVFNMVVVDMRGHFGAETFTTGNRLHTPQMWFPMNIGSTGSTTMWHYENNVLSIHRSRSSRSTLPRTYLSLSIR